jgi:hypothetical protein
MPGDHALEPAAFGRNGGNHKELAVPHGGDEWLILRQMAVNIGWLANEARCLENQLDIGGGKRSCCRKKGIGAQYTLQHGSFPLGGVRCQLVVPPVVSANSMLVAGIEQAVHMDDEVTDHGVIDRPLRSGFPGIVGGLVIRVNTDDVEIADVLEFNALKIIKFTAENEV